MRLLALALCLSLAAPAYGADAANPYPRGTGKKVAGIIVVSVLPAVGALFALISLIELCRSGDTAQHCRDTRNARTFFALSSVGLVAGGIVGGVSLIAAGRADRKRWQDWEDEHKEKPEARAAPNGLELSLSLPLSGR